MDNIEREEWIHDEDRFVTAFEDNKKLSNQLGYYIGEFIVNKFLPTLSCDMIQSYNVIKITEEEQKKYSELNDKWFNKTQKNRTSKSEGIDEAKEEWNEYRKYSKQLTEKYIPKTLDCHIPILEENGLDIKLFKEGIGVALWDCDMCYYDCTPDDIEIHFSDNQFDFPRIILKRSEEQVG